MLDFSWSELLVVLIVAVLVIGPQQIPQLLFHLGKFIRRLQYMRFALTKQFDDVMSETELRDLNFEANLRPKSEPKQIEKDFFDESLADSELDEDRNTSNKENQKNAE